MKRTSFLTAMAVALCLTGCGGNKATESKGATTLGSEGKYEKPLTVTLGRFVTADPRLPKNDTYTDNAYTRYINERLNVTFKDEFEATGSEFDRQVSLSIAAGEIPDIMTVGSEEILKELINADLLADLSGVYQQYASPKLKSIYDSYNGRCLAKATFDGKLMALPGTRGDDQPYMFWIRQDWIEKLGLAVDTDRDLCITVAELEAIARAFIENDAGGSGSTLGLAFSPGLGDELIAMGAAFSAFPNRWLKDASGKVYYGSTTNETKNVITQLKTWYDSGILDPQFGTRTWDDISALLINQKLGIVPGAWHVPDWRLGAVKATDPNTRFKAYTLSDANGKIHVNHVDAAERFVVVSKTFANPELAILLANILYDELNVVDPAKYPDVANYIAQGVDNSTKPLWIECGPATSLTDEYQEYEEMVAGTRTTDEASAVYIKQIGQSILNFIDHPETATTGEWSYYTSRMWGQGLINDTMKAGKLEWVTPVFWGQTDTLRQRGGNLSTLQEESFAKIITGKEAISHFDTFVSRWTNEGGAQVIKEIEALIQ